MGALGRAGAWGLSGLAALTVLAPAVHAGDSGAGTVTPGHIGSFTVVAAARPSGESAQTGEGVLTVTMAGPGTSWGDGTNTSVVVEAALDGGQWQTFVLFEGGQPFAYSGFTGPLRTGRHIVTLSVDGALSHSINPSAVVSAIRLSVVTPDDPDYVALANAPVMYERSYGATGDTPLLQWASPSPDPGGGTRLEYQTVWSHEDIGDSVVPANEWGKWGRMTDIDPTIWFTVVRDPSTGAFLPRGATMDGCSYCPASAPAAVTDRLDGDDADAAFHGQYFGSQPVDHHPVIRIFTGNGDVTDQGTSPFRFQQVLVPPPEPGQTREAVMDQHPWTYRIMAQEVRREYGSQYSTDPRLFLPGDARQYAMIDLNVDPISGNGQTSIAVELTMSGDPTVYSDDYRQMTGISSTYPFYVGGHARTVVKLPVDWHDRAITAINLRLNYPPGASPPKRATVRSLSVIELTSQYQLTARALPALTISTFPELVPIRP